MDVARPATYVISSNFKPSVGVDERQLMFVCGAQASKTGIYNYFTHKSVFLKYEP